MKNKKKLDLKKMNVAQLGTIKGGIIKNPFRDIINTGAPSEQPFPGGGGCYSDAPTSCVVCV